MTPNKLLIRVFFAFTIASSLLLFYPAQAQPSGADSAAVAAAEPGEEEQPAAQGAALGLPTEADRISEGQSLFKANCKTCHNVHKKLVGPALKDVYTRAPSIDWIVNFVNNSSKVIASGDVYANKLYEEYNKTQMTAFPTLSRDQILNILGYIKQETEKGPEEPSVIDTAGGGSPVQGDGVPTGYLNAIMIGLVIVLVLIFIVLILITTVLKKYLNQRTDLDEYDREVVNSSFSLEATVKSKPFLFLVIFIFTAVAFKVVINNLYAVGVQKGYAPKQPIAFSHKLHAGDNDIDCNYCHTGVRISKNANIPSPNICMNCHSMIKNVNGEAGVSAEIQKIYDAIEDNRPIEWIRIHNLPDLAYFNHSQHVQVGNIECQTCHGEIQEMEVVGQHALLTMGWCIDCHRKTDINSKGNEYYDNLVELHDQEGKEALKVEDIGGLECSKCHY